MKNKLVFKIGIFCGLLTMTVGIFIFLTWWAARAFFAIDLDNFEVYGFLWGMISFPIAGLGLILVTFVFIRNFRNHLKTTISGLILILTNLPILYGILVSQAELEKRAYIKIYNKGTFDLTEITLKGSDFENDIGSLDCLTSTVTFYYPKYLDERDRDSYPTIEPVKLMVTDKLGYQTFILPRIDKGQCKKLYIDKENNLLNNWE